MPDIESNTPIGSDVTFKGGSVFVCGTHVGIFTQWSEDDNSDLPYFFFASKAFSGESGDLRTIADKLDELNGCEKVCEWIYMDDMIGTVRMNLGCQGITSMTTKGQGYKWCPFCKGKIIQTTGPEDE